jgi:murein DD-endopeptidase MepM/ murein hydrolase activator NlpD
MSIRVSRRALKNAVAIGGLLAGAVALSGCSSLGSRSFGDSTMTSSVGQSSPASLNQPMPSSLGARTNVAEGQFLPPANVNGGGGWNNAPVGGYSQPMTPMGSVAPAGSMPSVQSQDLPVLSSQSSMGTQPAMQAQPSLAPLAPLPPAVAMGAPPSNLAAPASTQMAAAPVANTNGAYTHTIANGESLYTIARRYDVTTQALVQANGLSSPDNIVVGQSVIIPGRSDLMAAKGPAPVTQLASAAPVAPVAPAGTAPTTAPGATTIATLPTTPAAAQPAAAPAKTATAPAAEPPMSGNDKFRWPVSGRVLTDFASSKGTGINIEAAEGSAVGAAENGTVIYVGSGVEGYGNLILIRHPNGYVSAYAHLKSMSVAKGAVVNRGDTIGAAGMSGSVSKPQLHFELRKGATPVDPMPLLAG